MTRPERVCMYCKQPNGGGPRELRPYGPGGADVCFECALASPEKRRETEREFAAKLNAAEVASGEGIALLPGDGPPLPYPIKKRGRS